MDMVFFVISYYTLKINSDIIINKKKKDYQGNV